MEGSTQMRIEFYTMLASDLARRSQPRSRRCLRAARAHPSLLSSGACRGTWGKANQDSRLKSSAESRATNPLFLYGRGLARGFAGVPTASATLWIPAFAGMTEEQRAGMDGLESENDRVENANDGAEVGNGRVERSNDRAERANDSHKSATRRLTIQRKCEPATR